MKKTFEMNKSPRPPLQKRKALGNGYSAHLRDTTLATVFRALLLFTCLYIFYGCGPRPAPVLLRLSIWGDIPEIEMIQRVVDNFEKSHPRIQVQIDHPANYFDSTIQQFREQTPPDVLSVEIHHLRRFIEEDMLLPLDTLVAQDRHFSTRDYEPGVLNFFTRQGHLYAIPRDIAPIGCVYYNRDLFDAAGQPYPNNQWQWPGDLLSAAQALTRRDDQGQIRCYGLMDDWPIWDAFVLSNGGTYVHTKDGVITGFAVDSPEALAALQFRHDLIHTYRVMPTPAEANATQELGASDFFLSGKTAMLISGLWKAPYFSASPDLHWDIALFPTGPQGPRRFPTGGSGYGISQRSAHPAEAWQLVSFLTGLQGQTLMAQSGLIQPALREAARAAFVSEQQTRPGKIALLAAADAVIFFPDDPIWDQFMANYLQPAMNEAWARPAKDIRPLLRSAIQQASDDLLGVSASPRLSP